MIKHPPAPGPRIARIGLLAALCIALTSTACGIRTLTDKVYVSSGTEVLLRHQRQGRKDVDRGYEHPVVISAQRVAHILGAIDIEFDDEDAVIRQSAVHPEILLRIANGVSEALAKATPSQEVVVMSVRKQERLGIFNRKYLTSFVLANIDDQLRIDFSRVDWEIPKGTDAKKGKNAKGLPVPHAGERVMNFRVVPTFLGMHSTGRQIAVVDWRAPVFAKPVRAEGLGSGEVRRRTVLMEMPIPASEGNYGIEPELARQLSPETLRALAALGEERRRGEITEAEYQKRFDNLLRAAQD